MIIIKLLLIIMEGSKTLFCYSKFAWSRKRICSKYMEIVSGFGGWIFRAKKSSALLPSEGK